MVAVAAAVAVTAVNQAGADGTSDQRTKKAHLEVNDFSRQLLPLGRVDFLVEQPSGEKNLR
jgi:hypothetical protein